MKSPRLHLNHRDSRAAVGDPAFWRLSAYVNVYEYLCVDIKATQQQSGGTLLLLFFRIFLHTSFDSYQP